MAHRVDSLGIVGVFDTSNLQRSLLDQCHRSIPSIHADGFASCMWLLLRRIKESKLVAANPYILFGRLVNSNGLSAPDISAPQYLG